MQSSICHSRGRPRRQLAGRRGSGVFGPGELLHERHTSMRVQTRTTVAATLALIHVVLDT